MPNTEDILYQYLVQSGLGDTLPLILGKRFIGLDDFLPVPVLNEYAKLLTDYFDFYPILDDKNRQELRRSFRGIFEHRLNEGSSPSLLNVKEIVTRAQSSLDEAFLFLPFNAVSNEKALRFFSENANALFASFKRNFFDSEQAIRLFICKGENKEKWEELSFEEDKTPIEVGTIKQIYVNIASVRYMCPICQGTYRYDIVERKSMVRGILRAAFRSQLPKPGDTSLGLASLPPLVVYVSGIKPTTKE